MHAFPQSRLSRFVAIAVTSFFLFAASAASATIITVGFGSLPSSQGWTYGTGGSPLATEAGTWSVSGGVLTLDTMAFTTTGAGTTSYYFQTGVVNTTQPLAIVVRARVLQGAVVPVEGKSWGGVKALYR